MTVTGYGSRISPVIAITYADMLRNVTSLELCLAAGTLTCLSAVFTFTSGTILDSSNMCATPQAGGERSQMTLKRTSQAIKDDHRQEYRSSDAGHAGWSGLGTVRSWLHSEVGALRAASSQNVSFMKQIPSRDAVLRHLYAVLDSPAFARSRRSQQFLRYVVLESLEGRSESISEWNIACEVFGRGVSFNSGEYSLVRVKAGEVRRRLAKYYESTPASDFRIELPLGGYVPRIEPTERATEKIDPQQETAEGRKTSLSRRRFVWIAGGAFGALGMASVASLLCRKSEPLDLLWRPVFSTKAPLLIFLPVLSNRETGEPTDRVGIGPAAVVQHAADFLNRHNHPYRLRFGTDLNFSELKEQPSLLLGGFSSKWTTEWTRGLRFCFAWNDEIGARAIIDSQTNKVWHPVNAKPNGYADQDYGILCRLFNAESGQIELIAGGITTFGTEGAGDALFNPNVIATVVKNAPLHWETRNLQAVVRVSVIGTTPSSPEVIATHFW